MEEKKKIVIFSHGFGILKDNLGLFTYISQNLEKLGYSSILFDYNEFNPLTNEIYTIPFSKQAEILRDNVSRTLEKYPDSEIYIIGHSQGSLIPALIDCSGIKKVIGISPFFLTVKEEVLARYNSRPGSSTDFSKVSKRPHSDGKITVIQPSYWEERFNTNQYELYNNLGNTTQLTLIYGDSDSLTKSVNLEMFKTPKLIQIPGNHDFTNEYKVELLNRIIEILK